MRTFTKSALARLKQARFLTAQAPTWATRCFKPSLLAQSQVVNCIYIEYDDHVDIVASSCWIGRMDSPQCEPPTSRWRGDFKSYLLEHRIGDYGSILYVLDSYSILCRTSKSDDLALPRRPMPLRSSLGQAIEWLLNESHGRLLWDYQFENLLSLFFPRPRATELWKGINAERADAWHELSITMVEGTLSVAQLVRDRTLSGHTTVAPNTKGALAICQLLFSDEAGRGDST